MNLKRKLIEIRKQVAFLQKDTKAYNYKYVSEDKVLFAIKDTMDELGVLLVPSVLNHSSKEFEYNNKRGELQRENIVSGDLVFTWYDADSDESLVVPFALYGQQQDASQAFGSALTYCNRYFLLKFFQVATNENDPDKLISKRKENEDKEYHKKVNPQDAILKGKLVIDKELDLPANLPYRDEAIKNVCAMYGWKSWESITFKNNDEFKKIFALVKQELNTIKTLAQS